MINNIKGGEKMNTYKNKYILLIAIALLFIATNQSRADMYDLKGVSAGGFDEVTINDAVFQNVNAASTGSGKIHSFVRINGGSSEEGYNTDARPVEYDENTSPQFTRSLLLSMVPTINLDGVLYREFLLDINQDKSGDGRFLSLDKLEIYLANEGDLTGHQTGDIGTMIYEMGKDVSGADNWILMDYSLNHGSGSGDLFAYIPNSLFDFESLGSYVYLYSMFGASNNGAYPNTASFEEWAVRKDVGTPPPVPVPGAVLLGFIGLFVAGKKLRKYA